MHKRLSAGSLLLPISMGLVVACSAPPPEDLSGGGADSDGAAGTQGNRGGRGGSGGAAGSRATGGGGAGRSNVAGAGGTAGKIDAGSSGGASNDGGDEADSSGPHDATVDAMIGRDAIDAGLAETGRIDAPADGGSEAGAGDGGGGASDAGQRDAVADNNDGTTSNGCPVKLEGWATVNADNVDGTTGGGNAVPTTVTTFAELKAAVQDSKPRVVVVSGTIKTTDGGGSALAIASNKTIVGGSKSATIYGGLVVNHASNVIVRNLNIHGVWPNTGPDDTLASHGSHHVWWDHLNVWDSGDGSLDITNQSNYQTVSYCKFWYTNKDHPHRLASLNGSGGGDHPEDAGYLKVTYHHNWWADLVDQRMPRVMYGQGHQYNNYFNSPGNLYCIGVGSYGAILVENNYFKDVKGAHIFMYALPMSITARGNVYENTTGNRDTGAGGTGTAVTPFTDPPYDYTLNSALDVPAIVQRCAGPQ